MTYYETITLKDGRKCCLRHCTEKDGAEVLEVFTETHRQTDFMLTYADESTMTAEQEGEYLGKKINAPDEIEILAEVDGKVVGTAGITPAGTRCKIRHRAGFGVGIDERYWGLGIGKALTQACIQCAKNAGYSQLELDVVADNERAAALYRGLGFIEYGRNPRGFRSRLTGYQELILMRLELE